MFSISFLDILMLRHIPVEFVSADIFYISSVECQKGANVLAPEHSEQTRLFFLGGGEAIDHKQCLPPPPKKKKKKKKALSPQSVPAPLPANAV